MAKVYVSSTIVDLKAERQAVIDWLVAAQHQVVHSYRPLRRGGGGRGRGP